MNDLFLDTWYEIQKGAKFQAIAYDTKAKSSPLRQGGLEIPIKVKIIWPQEEKLLKFKAKVEAVKYPLTGEYNRDSKFILNKTGVQYDEGGDKLMLHRN